jgi:hypothetical protein
LDTVKPTDDLRAVVCVVVHNRSFDGTARLKPRARFRKLPFSSEEQATGRVHKWPVFIAISAEIDVMVKYPYGIAKK